MFSRSLQVFLKSFILALVVGSVLVTVVVKLTDEAGRVLAFVAQTDPLAGTLSFTDITAMAGMASTTSGSHGAFWADATGDGRPDLFLSYNECRSGERANRFYRNLGNGTFAEETAQRGLYYLSGGSHGGSWSDLDNDGDYDLLVGDTYRSDCIFFDPPALANKVFRNDGTGAFIDRTPPDMAAYPPPGSPGEGYTRSILGFDMEGDGDLDIYAVNGDRGSNEPFFDRNELYRNNGGFNFTAITTGPLVTTPAGQAGADVDYDGDGDVDILLPNFGGFNQAAGDLGVLRNDGNGTFTPVPRTSIGISHRASTGISTGDLNNDGRTDLIFVDQDRDPLRPLGFDRIAYLYLNAGGGTFTFAAEFRGFGGFTAGLADLDNDGDLDLTFPALPYVLLNDGTARFTRGPFYPTPTPEPGCIREQCMRPDARTVAFADIDDDGDLDSVVTTKFGPFYTIRNNFDAGNWLKVRLTSPQGMAGAFGAKVRVFRAGTTSMITWREAKNVYGYLSQDDPVLHFGLGSATTVDIEVTYLDGSRVTHRGATSNQTIAFSGATIVESPTAPRNLTTSIVGSLITLFWNPPAGGGAPSSYQIEAGTAPGVTNLASITINSSATSFSASAPAGAYYLRVRARNAAAISGPSNEVVARIGLGCQNAPVEPVNLTQAVSGFTVNLNWMPAASGEAPTTYVIEAGSQPGFSNLAQASTGTTATAFATLAPPGTYFVRVRARNACGTSAPSNEVVVRVGCQTMPLAPTGLTSIVSGSSVTLTWTAPSTGDSPSTYVIEAGSQPGANNVAQIDTGNAATSISGSVTPGTYFVRVRSRNSCGTSSVSNEVTFRIG